jgi:hypothetical protein
VHTHLAEGISHDDVSISTIRGHRLWYTVGPSGDAPDGRDEHGRIVRVAHLDVVVDHDTVFVVDDLGLLCRVPRNAALGRPQTRTT